MIGPVIASRTALASLSMSGLVTGMSLGVTFGFGSLNNNLTETAWYLNGNVSSSQSLIRASRTVLRHSGKYFEASISLPLPTCRLDP